MILVIVGSLITGFGAVLQWKDKRKAEKASKESESERKKLDQELREAYRDAGKSLIHVRELQEKLNASNDKIIELNNRLFLEQTGGENKPNLVAFTEEPNLGYLSQYWFSVQNDGATPIYDLRIVIYDLHTHPKYYSRNLDESSLYFVTVGKKEILLGNLGKGQKRYHIGVVDVRGDFIEGAHFIELEWRNGRRKFLYEFGLDSVTKHVKNTFSREYL